MFSLGTGMTPIYRKLVWLQSATLNKHRRADAGLPRSCLELLLENTDLGPQVKGDKPFEFAHTQCQQHLCVNVHLLQAEGV